MQLTKAAGIALDAGEDVNALALLPEHLKGREKATGTAQQSTEQHAIFRREGSRGTGRSAKQTQRTHPNRQVWSAPHAGVPPPVSSKSLSKRIQFKTTASIKYPRPLGSEGWKVTLTLERCGCMAVGVLHGQQCYLQVLHKAASAGCCSCLTIAEAPQTLTTCINPPLSSAASRCPLEL